MCVCLVVDGKGRLGLNRIDRLMSGCNSCALGMSVAKEKEARERVVVDVVDVDDVEDVEDVDGNGR
jgi:hypothetical protein